MYVLLRASTPLEKLNAMTRYITIQHGGGGDGDYHGMLAGVPHHRDLLSWSVKEFFERLNNLGNNSYWEHPPK